MSYIAPPIFANYVARPHLSFWQQINLRVAVGGSTPASGALTANRAYYVPYRIPAPTIARRMYISVGAVGGTDSCSIGIYDANANLIVKTGNTVVGTANQVQHIDITDTYLGAGDYYLGYAQSGTTATIFRITATTADAGKIIGSYIQNTAYPLPDPAVFGTTANNIFPIFGIATTASP